MSGGTQQREYDFTIVLSGLSPSDETADSKLFNAGCDDATLSFRSGRPYLTFSRQSDSLKGAIVSAIENVHAAGYEVRRVDMCDLVSQSDIARRIGRSRQNVSQFVCGTRGSGGFPPPACNITDDHPLWYWCEVAHWLYDNDMLREAELDEAVELAVINAVLELKYHKQITPDLLKDMICALTESGTFFDVPCCP